MEPGSEATLQYNTVDVRGTVQTFVSLKYIMVVNSPHPHLAVV